MPLSGQAPDLGTGGGATSSRETLGVTSRCLTGRKADFQAHRESGLMRDPQEFSPRAFGILLEELADEGAAKPLLR